MRTFILIFSILGVVLFGGAFIASYVNPVFVESAARDMVRTEVEKRVGEKIDALENSKIVALTIRFSGRNTNELADLKRMLEEKLPQNVAAVATQMRNPDCPCRTAVEGMLTLGIKDRASALARIEKRLSLLIRNKYVDVATSLTREFRIFTGANAIVFALLGATLTWRRKAGIHFVLPAMTLIGAAAIVGYLYLFQQDWLHTIVFGDYVGFAYFGYLGIAMAFLADIAFNRARVTAQLLNAFFNFVGAAASAVPC